jgi:5-methylcytosine-specific restriction endonuclease McrA
MSSGSTPNQQLLFGDDPEALAQEAAHFAAREQKRAYAAARKLAWEQGKPFPEDEAKYYAAHPELRELANARCREAYREHYASSAEYYLSSRARSRAERMGCKVGRRWPMVDVYWRAVHAPVLLCHWCKKLTFPGERHVDHKQPLSIGGAHVAGNLCITCKDCNLSKGDTSPTEFQKIVAEKRAANGVIAADYFKRHPQDTLCPVRISEMNFSMPLHFIRNLALDIFAKAETIDAMAQKAQRDLQLKLEAKLAHNPKIVYNHTKPKMV